MRRLQPNEARSTMEVARDLAERLHNLYGSTQSREVIAEIESLTERVERVAAHLPRDESGFELGRALAQESAPPPQPEPWRRR